MTDMKALARTCLPALLALGVATAGVTTAGAQSSDAAPKAQSGASAEQKAAMQAQMRVRQLQKQISQLQNKALEQNPELQSQRDELKSLVQEKMKEQGVDPEASGKRLQAIREQVQGGNVSKEKQKSLAEEFRSKRGELMKARRSAMQSEAVRTERKAFREDLMAAMKKIDPNADKLVANFRQAISEMRQSRQRGGGMSGGGG